MKTKIKHYLIFFCINKILQNHVVPKKIRLKRHKLANATSKSAVVSQDLLKLVDLTRNGVKRKRSSQ